MTSLLFKNNKVIRLAKQKLMINTLKPKLVLIVIKDAVRSTKNTENFMITKSNWLKLKTSLYILYSNTNFDFIVFQICPRNF